MVLSPSSLSPSRRPARPLLAVLLLLAAVGCQAVEPPEVTRRERASAWRLQSATAAVRPRMFLGVLGDGGEGGLGGEGGEGGEQGIPREPLYLVVDCSFDHFGLDATWGGPWPPTDLPNEGYHYARGEVILYLDGRERWREAGAGYSRPGMISAGSDLADPDPLLAALPGAQRLDIEARFDDGVTHLLRLDLSGEEETPGLKLAREKAIGGFVQQCHAIRAGHPS